MSRGSCLLLFVIFSFLVFSPKISAQNGHGGQTRLLRTPTVSATQIGFAYATNIWVASRDLDAERRAALLDCLGRRRRRRADDSPARVPGKNLTGRDARRLSHEQLVGRRTSQLSRRPESPDLDRRSQNLRSRFAAVD